MVAEMIYKGSQRRQIQIWTSRAVGSGAFGIVFPADLLPAGGSCAQSEPEVLAVKTFKSLITDVEYALLSLEASRWERLDHPRILPFYGMCEFGIQQVGLVSRLITRGNMNEYISKFPDKNRLILLGQVAEGLHYLHSSAGIVHGDLKGANVMISDSECALLADFGLSTFVQRTGNVTATSIRMCYTVPFAAPELFMDEAFNEGDTEPRSKTTYSDAFAFGCLVYEASAGEAPWRGISDFAVIRKVQGGETPPRVVNNALYLPFSDDVWKLCLACWKKDPFARPNSGTILKTMTELATSAE